MCRLRTRLSVWPPRHSTRMSHGCHKVSEKVCCLHDCDLRCVAYVRASPCGLQEIKHGCHTDVTRFWQDCKIVRYSAKPRELCVLPTRDTSVASVALLSQQTRDVEPMLFWCWANVEDGGSTLKQHWFNVSCLLGKAPCCFQGNRWRGCTSGCSIQYTILWHVWPRFKLKLHNCLFISIKIV